MFTERSDNSEASEPISSGPIVLSLDIDGTLEEGDPPGPIGMDLVARAVEMGYVVGSASDRTIAEQRKIWERQSFAVQFVTHKHHLHQVAAQFPGHRLIHIGDTDVDAHYAQLAGFEFHFVTRLPEPGTTGWIF